MNNTLFIGNGLNRTLKGVSWNSVMNELTRYTGQPLVERISFPLEFERQMNLKVAFNPDKQPDSLYSRAKKRVSDSVKGLVLDADAIHNEIKNISCDSIITTNYDVTLEKVFENDYKPFESSRTFVDEITATIDDIDFYHAHGTIASTKSICLGYEHYVRLLKRISKDIDKNIRGVLQEKKNNDKWFYKFFTDNVFIVGFGLAECEIDIWSVLTHRATLYYKNRNDFQNLITNDIVYYEIINDIDGKDKLYASAKCSLLRGAHVEVVEEYISKHISPKEKEIYLYQTDDDIKDNLLNEFYIKIYRDIFDDIKYRINDYEED